MIQNRGRDDEYDRVSVNSKRYCVKSSLAVRLLGRKDQPSLHHLVRGTLCQFFVAAIRRAEMLVSHVSNAQNGVALTETSRERTNSEYGQDRRDDFPTQRCLSWNVGGSITAKQRQTHHHNRMISFPKHTTPPWGGCRII
jgi:hypothetical protein